VDAWTSDENLWIIASSEYLTKKKIISANTNPEPKKTPKSQFEGNKNKHS
jgi:hypothetical protein